MKVEINNRENGACPLCIRNGNCALQKALQKALHEYDKPVDHEMELVIYTCPRFKEKA
ncbi:hypothetical protein [Marispirochaeta sp.]|uniref:hypothetical protein n=1 Tax=Marispirochaeta sp. TaxID=2038653 RepID=UPI0029C82E7E|nr:hypothetical protein [Marispirochaeta sp.]